MSSPDQPESKTRVRILEATWQLMEERRGLGVRMTDVASKAGVSRQAVYDHFGNRANLIMATTHYVDEITGLPERARHFDAATNGVERLERFVDFWGDHAPKVYSIARALMADRERDEAAAAAWDDRMSAVREACQATIEALERDETLAPGWSVEEATDFLWTLLSFRNWEQLTIECGWSEEHYTERMTVVAKQILVRQRE